MKPYLALLFLFVGVGYLFFLGRDSSVRTSRALWLCVFWFAINGSRPVTFWLTQSFQASVAVFYADDSSIDQIIAGSLILIGIIVLARRADVNLLLKQGWPIALYFAFCLISTVWAEFPVHSFTRWFKSLGDLLMILIVATDAQPGAALRRLFSYVAFLLLPASVVMQRYFPQLARKYDLSGSLMNTGVTTNKNMLGVLCFVLGLGVSYQILRLIIDKDLPNRSRQLFAQLTLLYCVISLLRMADSATSSACFFLGSVFMVACSFPWTRRRPAFIHTFVLSILICGGLVLLLGKGAFSEAMGRSSDFHGRTQVWEFLLTRVPNSMVGAGFESFWYGSSLKSVWRVFPLANEAHNGYLEVYLNLGLFGIALIALILFLGYLKAVASVKQDPSLGSLLVAFVLTATIYSITEAGFRMLAPIWLALILSIVVACRIARPGAVDPVQEVKKSGGSGSPVFARGLMKNRPARVGYQGMRRPAV
jgi:O-antigen ligase